jgi:hypothetical protein
MATPHRGFCTKCNTSYIGWEHPCHTPQTEQLGANSLQRLGDNPYPHTIVAEAISTPLPKEEGGWKRAFKEKFCEEGTGFRGDGYYKIYDDQPLAEILDYIAKTIKQARLQERQEIMNQVEEMRKEYDIEADCRKERSPLGDPIGVDGYNLALVDLTIHLKDK